MFKNQHMLNMSLQMYTKLKITFLILSLTGKLMNFVKYCLYLKEIDDDVYMYLWTLIILLGKRSL